MGDTPYATGEDVTLPKKDSFKASAEWAKMEGKKSSLLSRCQDYAKYTLPYILPPKETQNEELQGALDSIGARAVNHLSNKLISTLFAEEFFRLHVTSDMLKEVTVKAEQGDKDAKELLSMLDKALIEAERNAMRELEIIHHRTEATMASKALIITGNSLMYHPDKKGKGGKVQTYGLRDYCVSRDLSGNVVDIMTRDKKAFNTFSKTIRDVLTKGNPGKYKHNTNVTIYTCINLYDDGKYYMTQYADDLKLDSEGSWPYEELPWIVLTWNLIRGEDYGRGLVEDYAGAFHALYVLANAEVDMVGIASDIKFLVDPGSTLDVEELNKSESGSYHSGKEGDITTPDLNKQMDMKAVESMVTRLGQQVGAAFLMQSAVTRDAERVTAEEVRLNANELEAAYGGIYSRFASDWQEPTAYLVLRRINLDLGLNKTIYPQIITGLATLSREGDLSNLRLLITDLVALQQVPESFLAAIDPTKYVAFCASRRGVDYTKFTKTPEQMQAEQQAMMAQQQAAMQAEQGAKAAGNIATAVAKQQ